MGRVDERLRELERQAASSPVARARLERLRELVDGTAVVGYLPGAVATGLPRGAREIVLAAASAAAVLWLASRVPLSFSRYRYHPHPARSETPTS